MKYHQIFFLFSISLWMVPLCGWAQENNEGDKPNELTVDAQLMSRVEERKGGLPGNVSDKDENRSHFISGRARMSIGYEKEHLSFKVTAQHQGVWGAEGGGKFNIYEAWTQLKNNNGLFARVGRQELVYDDERILGNNDWAMAAMYHDVLKVGYENDKHQFHAIVAYNQNSSNVYGGTFYQNGSQSYKSMQTAWYHYQMPQYPLGVSLIFMNIGMEAGTADDYNTIYQQLMGGYVKWRPGNLSLEAAYYLQRGKASLDYSINSSLPLKAWMASVKASYQFNSQLSGYCGFDYLSGDKDFTVPQMGNIGLTKHSKMSAFTSVFGSTHKFYGAMDFFYVSAYYGTCSPGLQKFYLGAIYKPFKGFSCDASYHYLATSSQLQEVDKTLGHEVELRSSYQLLKDATISLGFSYMKGTETMELLKRSTDKHQLLWGWLMLNISPRIFSTKW